MDSQQSKCKDTHQKQSPYDLQAACNSFLIGFPQKSAASLIGKVLLAFKVDGIYLIQKMLFIDRISFFQCKSGFSRAMKAESKFVSISSILFLSNDNFSVAVKTAMSWA